jgi:hypothetical protein
VAEHAEENAAEEDVAKEEGLMSAKTLPGPSIRDVTLREMLEEMSSYRDDEAFRWFQTSVVNARGEPQATDTLRVSMGQARLEVLR